MSSLYGRSDSSYSAYPIQFQGQIGSFRNARTAYLMHYHCALLQIFLAPTVK